MPLLSENVVINGELASLPNPKVIRVGSYCKIELHGLHMYCLAL